MSLWKEFKAFAIKGNVIDLAVAVVIGAAFTKIVNAIVQAIIMPLVGKILPSGGWQSWELGGLKIGTLLAATVEFFIVAFVIFILVVKIVGALKKKEPPPAPSTKKCGECLEEIPLDARRCRACTSPQPTA